MSLLHSYIDLRHEQLSALLLGIVGAGDGVTIGAFMREDLKVVSSLERFVTKEVDLNEALVLR